MSNETARAADVTHSPSVAPAPALSPDEPRWWRSPRAWRTEILAAALVGLNSASRRIHEDLAGQLAPSH